MEAEVQTLADLNMREQIAEGPSLFWQAKLEQAHDRKNNLPPWLLVISHQNNVAH